MLGYQFVDFFFQTSLWRVSYVLISTLRTDCAVGPKDGGSAPLEQASSGIPHQQLPRGEKIS